MTNTDSDTLGGRPEESDQSLTCRRDGSRNRVTCDLAPNAAADRNVECPIQSCFPMDMAVGAFFSLLGAYRPVPSNWARYSVGDWPRILLKTRLKWVSDWKPTSNAISLTLKLGFSRRFFDFSIRTLER